MTFSNFYLTPSVLACENIRFSSLFAAGDVSPARWCWEVIEGQTENTLSSEEFVTLERSVVESVVKNERLNVKEVDLFKAVDRWATKEVEKQGLTPDGVVKRRILGEEIVKAIRFPVMSQKEFASVVVDCEILTKGEIGFMMKHYVGVALESSLPFMHSPRQPRATRLKLSANSLPIRRLPIRQAEVVCQFDLSEKYSHFSSEPVRELLHSP